MTKMLGTRDVYGDVLIELGTANKDIVVLDADLSSSTRTSKFAKKFPDRFFNMGVSEQDMMGTAAGLASAGKIPFCSTFAVFATGRAWEQVRQSICLPKLNVKIVATHGGITVGEDGASHHSTEDIALMRVLPNMTVIVPADGYEAGAAIRTAAKYKGPVYIRLSREKFPVISPETQEFEIGKAKVYGIGEDVTIIAAGLMVHTAMEAADDLRKDGLSVGIINMSTMKPIDSNAVLTAARKSGAIVTVEEHSIIGGLGSAVAEVISENEPVFLKRIGINDRFGMSGRPAELIEHYGLTKDAIKKAVHHIVETKT
jgi:transketolase